MKGSYFDIQRFSLHDGPGIRTTVFLKGCPLHCLWCHNPESISVKSELGYFENKCLHCGACMLMCPNSAIVVDREHKKWSIDRDLCDGCGVCVDACFTQALTMAGKEIEVEDIINEVIKDQPYYEQSGGGLTISGGEPLYQFEFLLQLLQKAKSRGMHTSVETSGMASEEHFNSILPFTDLFLFDYKATQKEQHLKLCGVNNSLILSNLNFLYNQKASIELRCPLIPGINDTIEHLEAIAAFEILFPDLTSIRILPYHNIGNNKYPRYGIINPLPDHCNTSEEQIQQWKLFFENKQCKKVCFD